MMRLQLARTASLALLFAWLPTDGIQAQTVPIRGVRQAGLQENQAAPASAAPHGRPVRHYNAPHTYSHAPIGGPGYHDQMIGGGPHYATSAVYGAHGYGNHRCGCAACSHPQVYVEEACSRCGHDRRSCLCGNRDVVVKPGWHPTHHHYSMYRSPDYANFHSHGGLSYPSPETPAGVVQYPYYTLKGPDDFFMK